MKRAFIVAATSFATFAYGLTATAAEPLVRFEGGIGVDPVANTGVTNTVKGVPPGGVPWAIQKLKVNIKDDGSISASGEGLVLAAITSEPGALLLRYSRRCFAATTRSIRR